MLYVSTIFALSNWMFCGTELHFFQTGRLCEMLYSAPGNIMDWMYKRMKINYSYVLHLRDTGTVRLVLFLSRVKLILLLPGIARVRPPIDVDPTRWRRDRRDVDVSSKIHPGQNFLSCSCSRVPSYFFTCTLDER